MESVWWKAGTVSPGRGASATFSVCPPGHLLHTQCGSVYSLSLATRQGKPLSRMNGGMGEVPPVAHQDSPQAGLSPSSSEGRLSAPPSRLIFKTEIFPQLFVSGLWALPGVSELLPQWRASDLSSPRSGRKTKSKASQNFRGSACTRIHLSVHPSQ